MISKVFIDINCDVGEGIGNERALFPHISSCNIACGGHAGDVNTMFEIVQLARKFAIKVGAHPSYPDRENFGRKSMKIEKGLLISSIQKQIKELEATLISSEMQLHHIKAHGALYNDIAGDLELAVIYLESVLAYKDKVLLYLPYGSAIEKEARKQGFKIALEAFGDRNYNDDLSLVSRDSAQALIEDPKKVLEHLISMAINKEVVTLNGVKVPILADTFCIHGDTSTALQILMYLTDQLPKQHIFLRK
ncbi:5-oxoprolinase subunit PxpA [uncultured Eudoraea sp.]|uniref:5-oxoprolinase subunit PxpA n=1 Tax=uncultured Eudoraea sp. TaxID=1035614 RepID=UPI002623D768|nr:5-oxoprolinase subunit PxpA [uncultured Eudoraea sp.]